MTNEPKFPHSSRDFSLSLAAAIATLLAAVLIPVLSLRIIAAILLAAAIAWMIRILFRERDAIAVSSDSGSVQQQPRQDFAFGKLFDATMNGMREGLVVVDEDMRVIASNRAAHEFFPVAGGRLSSQRLTELTRNTQIYNAFRDALRDGTERSGLRIEMPDRRMFDLRVVPLTETVGSDTRGALGVFFDVTRLERLEKVRQEFLSNVSHELRTPLTAILAFVETLETGGLEDKENSQRFLEIIRKNASRMHILIDDILELSAIEAGNVQVKPEEIELHAIVNDVINSLTAKASARSVTIFNEVAAETTVFADSRRLEQMLTNLIDNAIKFNRESGSVTIQCQRGERDRILVEDTGGGIPPQHLERLFERFYRVDRARSRDLGGTGLGLAIVKHLAKAHAGEVSVQSKLGQGSVFTIDLPKLKPKHFSAVKSEPVVGAVGAGAGQSKL
jgi:two-component system phosphate regulon sensor histidine kinase PhoR